MRRPDSFAGQRGFFTFVQNNDETDYLNLAYCQALSIKCTQTEVTSYSIAVDSYTKSKLEPKHLKLFDHIIDIPDDASAGDAWKLKNEWKAWWITPYRETVKVESDILFTDSIDHWWDGMSQHEVCLTSNVRDYEGKVSSCRAYRKLLDDNLLPNVYNGVMYFRYGRQSKDFFIYARYVYEHWDEFKTRMLVNCVDDEPTTDVAFSIAAMMMGVENCTNPALTYPTFTHMKGAINGWGINTDWREKLYSQIDDSLRMTVGFSGQHYPFHYYQKNFITPTLVERYERAYERRANQ